MVLVLSACGGGTRLLFDSRPRCRENETRVCSIQNLTSVGNNIYVAAARARIYKVVPESEKMSMVSVKPENVEISIYSGITGTKRYLYLTDEFENVVFRAEIASGKVVLFAGNGKTGWHDGAASEASFHTPRNIVTDGNFLYVWDNYKIRKIDTNTGEVSTLAGSNKRGDVDGQGKYAQFSFVNAGLAVGERVLYVVNRWGSDRIRIVNKETGEVASLYVKTPDGSPGEISGGRVTKLGDFLYISSSSHVIQRVNVQTGIVITFAGKNVWRNWGWKDGIGSEAKFWLPQSIINDGTFLYVGDIKNNVIRKIDPVTREVSTIAKLKSMLENDEL